LHETVPGETVVAFVDWVIEVGPTTVIGAGAADGGTEGGAPLRLKD